MDVRFIVGSQKLPMKTSIWRKRNLLQPTRMMKNQRAQNEDRSNKTRQLPVHKQNEKVMESERETFKEIGEAN